MTSLYFNSFRLCSIGRWGHSWIMNFEGSGKKLSYPIRVTVVGIVWMIWGKPQKLKLRKAAVPVVGKTKELMNTNLDHYSHINLLSNCVNKIPWFVYFQMLRCDIFSLRYLMTLYQLNIICFVEINGSIMRGLERTPRETRRSPLQTAIVGPRYWT